MNIVVRVFLRTLNRSSCSQVSDPNRSTLMLFSFHSNNSEKAKERKEGKEEIAGST